MKMPLLWVCLALALVFCGCEPCPHYNRLQVANYIGPVKAPKELRKPYGTLRPYDKAQDVGRPFEVVGFMSCQAEAKDEAAILKAMLYRAADMGADGVLLNPNPVDFGNGSTNATDAARSWAAPIWHSSDRAYSAQAIKFK